MVVSLHLLAAQGVTGNYSPPKREALDEVCCPIVRHSRPKMLGIVWNPDSRLRKVAYIYQSSTYKQLLNETECQHPVYEEDQNKLIDKKDPRCNGRCEQLHGSQMMITLQPSPLQFSMTDIEIKIGCTFLSNELSGQEGANL